MIGRNSFDEAIRNGERNKETIPLIANWCGHAKVEGMSYGLLAQQTGLPIGHHAIRCDYASDDTISHFYELSEAAVDFYDRNCNGCPRRQGGRLPNILELVGARDRKREQQAAEDQRSAEAAAAALASRDAERGRLSKELSPLGQILIDDIGAYDRDRSRENLDRLMKSAQMAPEHFSAPLVNYIQSVLETANWLDQPGLEILGALNVEPERLASAAARVLSKGGFIELAGRILEPVVRYLSVEQVMHATPAAIDLASPDIRSRIGLPHRENRPELLNSLFRQSDQGVNAAIEKLFGMRTSHAVEQAARGLSALLGSFPQAAAPHRRTLISTYVRAEHLVTDFDDLHGELYCTADAIVGALDADPAGTDAMIQEYTAGATAAGIARVYELYGRALRSGYKTELPQNSERVRVAFRRLLWATTGEFNPEIVQTAVTAFRDGASDLDSVAVAEIEGLLSAPLVHADRLRALEEAPLDKAMPLAALERGNHRSSLIHLMKGLLGLAARAALKQRDLLPRLAEFLEMIPEDRHILRGVAIEEFAALAGDVTGMNFYLPHLYTAIVGTSSIERSYAADAIGELQQRALDNAPLLLLEAFVLLLGDDYVIVHKAAARAFRRSAIPEPLRGRALNAIYRLIRYYRTESGEDKFLADCVGILAGSADDYGTKSGEIRRYLIDVCMDIDPVFLRSEMRGLRHTLGSEPSFAKLVARMLPTMVDRFNRNEEAERLVRGLMSTTIREYEQEFEAVGLQLAPYEQWLTLVVIDALARAGAGEAAARVANARLQALEDVPRNRATRLFGRLVALTFEFENAAAARDGPAVESLASEWQEIAKAIGDHREESRERDRRSRLSFPN